ncbi:MAG: GAF domain-containing protein, partial [Anaerolineae bacterium]
MENFGEYFLQLLAQFAGGPGPRENNLVRFGLPAVLWAVLLGVAWTRQRKEKLPRERLLVWAFGLGLARELFMFSHVSSQLLEMPSLLPEIYLSEPLEHALTMATFVMVAGAFLRYILDDERLSRRYLEAGLATTAAGFLVTWVWWAQFHAANPQARFNQTWAGLISFLLVAFFAAVAIVLLAKERGWLRNTVSLALGLLVLIGLLRLANLLTGRQYDHVFCPICNSLHTLTIPILGYVYIREQSIEKQQAENALAAYREHLEDLVEARTSELTEANEQLQKEVAERKQAEASVVRRNTELAAQNAIAGTISRSLDLDIILNTAMDTVLAVLDMDAGCLYLLDGPDGELVLETKRGEMDVLTPLRESDAPCSCIGISCQAVQTMAPVVLRVAEATPGSDSGLAAAPEEGIQTLVSTPLVSQDRPVGALSLAARRPEAITAQELDMLAAIGQQIGMAVENARLYQEAGRMAEDLALLHESSVFLTGTLDPQTIYQQLTEQTTKLLGCHAASLFLWDEETGEAVGVFAHGLNSSIPGLRIHPEESGLLQELISQKGSVAVEDTQADPRVPPLWRDKLAVKALLCVPLWGKDLPLGFLFLSDLERPRHWREAEVAWAESFANHAAIALGKAYLYEQAERLATLEERQRIAADMHDGLAQTLSYLTLKSHHASDLLEEGDIGQALAEHHDIQAAMERATHEVRRSIASLQTNPAPPQPLQQSLQEIVDGFREEGGPAVTFATELKEPLFPSEGQPGQIARIVQEALLNARRHAAAGHISVTLAIGGTEATITVADDGRGFDPATAADHGDHFGLRIMRARAARIGGRVEIASAPGRGTRVTLSWPPAGGKPSKGATP